MVFQDSLRNDGRLLQQPESAIILGGKKEFIIRGGDGPTDNNPQVAADNYSAADSVRKSNSDDSASKFVNDASEDSTIESSSEGNQTHVVNNNDIELDFGDEISQSPSQSVGLWPIARVFLMLLDDDRYMGLGDAVAGLLRGFAWRAGLMALGVAFVVLIYFIPRLTAHLLSKRGSAPFLVGSRADGVFLRNLLFCGGGSRGSDKLNDFIFRNANPTIFQTGDQVALCSKDLASFFGSLDVAKYLPDGGTSLAKAMSVTPNSNKQQQKGNTHPPDLVSRVAQECSVDSIIDIPPNTPDDDKVDQAVGKLSDGFESMSVTVNSNDEGDIGYLSARALRALWKKFVFNSFVSDRGSGVRSLRSVFTRPAAQF